VQVDDRAGGSQEVHAEDAPEVEAVVHLADLQLEVVEPMAAKRKAVDPAEASVAPIPRIPIQRRSSISSSALVVWTKQNSRSGCWR
jgi:hypothetical protein